MIILNNQNLIVKLTEQLSNFEEGSEAYLNIQEQLSAVQADIEYCQQHIESLQTN